MSAAIAKEIEHLGETFGASDHDHDMIHDLSRRLDSLWRYDQYIANADGQTNLVEFWQTTKKQELKNIENLKKLVKQHIQNNCF
jgi:hypothetical protein